MRIAIDAMLRGADCCRRERRRGYHESAGFSAGSGTAVLRTGTIRFRRGTMCECACECVSVVKRLAGVVSCSRPRPSCSVKVVWIVVESWRGSPFTDHGFRPRQFCEWPASHAGIARRTAPRATAELEAVRMIQQSALVIGAGVAGIATAHYLALRPEIGKVTIVDRGQPMAFTSAQSGENYRNWWPHPVMTAFTDLSISLMEEIDRTTGGGIGMSRRGYALATRRTDIGDLVDALRNGYAATDALRFHGPGEGDAYVPPASADRRTAPDGGGHHHESRPDPAHVSELRLRGRGRHSCSACRQHRFLPAGSADAGDCAGSGSGTCDRNR